MRDLHKLFDLDNLPDMLTCTVSEDGGKTWSYPIDFPPGGVDPLSGFLPAYGNRITWSYRQQKDTQ